MPSSKSITTASRHSGKPGMASAVQELRAQAARNNAAEQRRITSRLRQALAQDEFALLYEVQTDLRSGAPRGAEVLICLQHRRRGLVYPSHFMPVAEHSDIVIEIGNWAMQQACWAAARLPPGFVLTIPVPHRQLMFGQLLKHVIQTFAEYNLDAGRIEFALTETAMIDENEDVNFALKALRGVGAGLVLDNFGTSYTSLSLLKRLPLTTLKLDRSMIAGLPDSRENAAILQATLQTAHALGLEVIADGVESESQARLIADLGCDFAQGVHWHPPVGFEELASRLGKG